MFQLLQLLIAIPTVAASAMYFANKEKSKSVAFLVASIAYYAFGPVSGSPMGNLFQMKNTNSIAENIYGAAMVLACVTICFYIYKMYNYTQPRKSLNANEDGSNPLATVDAVAPRYTFADVDGMDTLKAKLIENANAIINNGKNGILFHGLPGNGKTFIAEAFAGEVAKLTGKRKRVAFMPVSMSTLTSRWVGQTTEQVRNLFTQARAAARRDGACVLFIDEIDSLLINRENVLNADSEKGGLVNSMLTLLNDYRDFKRHGIFIVAATNFMDRLDSSAIREGRFDFKTEIAAPDEKARVSLLVKNAKDAALTTEVAEMAARRWEGFGVARMKHVGELAGKIAKKDGRKAVSFADLMTALREAQGCKGSNLPENTPSLEQLSFDNELGGNLTKLARRLTNVAEIEAKGGTIPKGVLFYGPPGTGKTAVAKSLAVSSGWAFLSTSGNSLMNNSDEFENMITKAADIRPCIVFIDEADDILADRATNPYGKSATNNLLALMDGDRVLQDIMFVAATNFEKNLDAAAIRGGRFSEHFEFTTPGENALVSIIRKFMNSKKNAPWAVEFTPEAAAAILNGLAPADANDRMQKAINRVVSESSGDKITLDDLRAVA